MFVCFCLFLFVIVIEFSGVGWEYHCSDPLGAGGWAFVV